MAKISEEEIKLARRLMKNPAIKAFTVFQEKEFGTDPMITAIYAETNNRFGVFLEGWKAALGYQADQITTLLSE